jgi:class 3 adenylate cyclase
MAQQSEPAVQTFLFADLSGFTALTEAHGDEQAADLVGGFCAAVRQLLADHQAHEVKTIGDAVMLRAGDAAAAIRLGLCIVHDVGAQHGFPLVRVGMHTGPAVERAGDWFGATVNLAARLSAAASGGDTLLTATTRTAAGDVQGVELRERGRWTFRNVTEPVQVYAAVRQGARSSAGLPVDPVCRMAVDPWHSAGRLTHEGVEYCFCSLGCAGAFAQHPARYTMTDHPSATHHPSGNGP